MIKPDPKRSDWPPPKDRKAEAFFKELERLMALASGAIKHLQTVTGKRGFDDIDPLLEKRWSEECWKSWTILVSIMTMFRTGMTQDESDKEILKSIQPKTNGWIGKVTIGEFKSLRKDEHKLSAC